MQFGKLNLSTTISRLIRARATSLGLVAALGFLLIVSLAVSADLTASGNYFDSIIPIGKLIFPILNFFVSLALLAALFAAIYKVLPDRRLEWRDVIIGAIVTSVLFTIGKSLVGWYLGSSAVASSYGAAGGLIVLLLWVYYSVQIFLLGAEFTKIFANQHGSKQDQPASLRPDHPPLRPKNNHPFRCHRKFDASLARAPDDRGVFLGHRAPLSAAGPGHIV